MIQASLRPLGLQLRRVDEFGGFDPTTPLPLDADTELFANHPKLRELESRYSAFDSPICKHTQWKLALHNTDDDVRYFRGDNLYVWAFRSQGEARHRFYTYAQYIQARDRCDLLGGRLIEDGAFGCFAYRFERMPTISRDLLDSINELYFLDRHCQVLTRRDFRVLDIGAGYGRLADRMLTVNEGVQRYWCIDAIPRSTFVCDYYLRYRGFAGTPGARAVIVPLDKMKTAIPKGGVDLAVNIHSFSEMCYDAIDTWVQWLAWLKVPLLFLVPNYGDLRSRESDGSQRRFADVFERAGYKLRAREPYIEDPDVRELVGIDDWFCLFALESA